LDGSEFPELGGSEFPELTGREVDAPGTLSELSRRARKSQIPDHE
jgi:hypothetical protein